MYWEAVASALHYTLRYFGRTQEHIGKYGNLIRIVKKSKIVSTPGETEGNSDKDNIAG